MHQSYGEVQYKTQSRTRTAKIRAHVKPCWIPGFPSVWLPGAFAGSIIALHKRGCQNPNVCLKMNPDVGNAPEIRGLEKKHVTHLL